MARVTRTWVKEEYEKTRTDWDDLLSYLIKMETFYKQKLEEVKINKENIEKLAQEQRQWKERSKLKMKEHNRKKKQREASLRGTKAL